MSWPRSNFVSTDKLSFTDLNSISAALQTWGGDVNAAQRRLTNLSNLSFGNAAAGEKIAIDGGAGQGIVGLYKNAVRQGYLSTGAGGNGVVLGSDGTAAVQINAGGRLWTFDATGMSGSMPTVRLTNSATQAIPNNAWTVLSFDTEINKTDAAMHSNTTNPSRLICPTAGCYLLFANVSFAANGNGGRSICARYIGSSQIALANANATTGGDTTVLCGSTLTFVNANDYFEIQTLQSSGGSLNVQLGGLSFQVAMVKLF